MAQQKITPLDWRTPMVNGSGCPTSQFLVLWQQLFGNAADSSATIEELQTEVAALESEKADKTTRVDAVSGETTGGGDLSANRSIGLANTAVTPGSYGDAAHVGAFTVDQKGRLTAASSIPLSSIGGVYLPLVDGSLPPNLMYLPSGNLLYVQVA